MTAKVVDYQKAIQAWEKRTGKGPIDFADLVAEEMGDSSGRVLNSVYLWRNGKRKPTGIRKAAIDAVLAEEG